MALDDWLVTFQQNVQSRTMVEAIEVGARLFREVKLWSGT